MTKKQFTNRENKMMRIMNRQQTIEILLGDRSVAIMTRWNEQIDAAQSVCLSTVSVRASYPPQCAHADNCISQTRIDKTVAICKLSLIRNINHYKGQNDYIILSL